MSSLVERFLRLSSTIANDSDCSLKELPNDRRLGGLAAFFSIAQMMLTLGN
jgi:hypothetical protein